MSKDFWNGVGTVAWGFNFLFALSSCVISLTIWNVFWVVLAAYIFYNSVQNARREN